jgi:hypothetical protein
VSGFKNNCIMQVLQEKLAGSSRWKSGPGKG